jgi:hypothetical protein
MRIFVEEGFLRAAREFLWSGEYGWKITRCRLQSGRDGWRGVYDTVWAVLISTMKGRRGSEGE